MMVSSSSHPAITILMPVFNGSKYLQETIFSILDQSFSNFELICVDDSSSDNSYDLLQSFMSMDSRLRLLQKPNGGTAAKALNFALPYVRGDYVFYTSQDDIMSNDLLGKLYDRAKETDADGVIPNMIWYFADGNNSRGIFVQKDKVISGREAASLSIDWKVHGFVLWKASLVKQIKYSEFGLCSDEYTTRLLFLNSRRVAFCDAFFYYRQNNQNAVTKKLSLALFDKLETNEKLRALFRDNSATTEENSRLANVSFNDICFFQRQLFEQGGKFLSQHDKKQAQKKLEIAYKNFTNMKEITVSRKARFLLTNGYNLFRISMWLWLNMKNLISSKTHQPQEKQ